jgi:hypothetical protein
MALLSRLSAWDVFPETMRARRKRRARIGVGVLALPQPPQCNSQWRARRNSASGDRRWRTSGGRPSGHCHLAIRVPPGSGRCANYNPKRSQPAGAGVTSGSSTTLLGVSSTRNEDTIPVRSGVRSIAFVCVISYEPVVALCSVCGKMGWNHARHWCSR